jgi:hypothetical protein
MSTSIDPITMAAVHGQQLLKFIGSVSKKGLPRRQKIAIDFVVTAMSMFGPADVKIKNKIYYYNDE